MKSWIERLTPKFLHKSKHKSSIPEGIWSKCPNCKQTVYTKDFIKTLLVCPLCNFHLSLAPIDRINMLLDEDTFEEMFDNITPLDPINFVDKVAYKDRIKRSGQKTGIADAVVTGRGKLNDLNVVLSVLDFDFMGGSMGSVVGEKITRLIEYAATTKTPFLSISNSGGARMQEGILSLMQMAKTSMALNKLRDNAVPYISILANPTMGGVSASFATLGDIILAEPAALIGFAGPRVIRQTIKQNLPEGFQLAEFQLDHGGIDRIVQRKDLKKELFLILSYLASKHA